VKSVLLAILALSIAGCAGGPSAKVNLGPPPVAVALAPRMDVQSELALIRQSGRVHVGDSTEAALVIFPPLQKSKEITELPEVLPGLSPAGWQAENEGFGMAVKDGKVALAMLTLNLLEASDVKNIADTYEADLQRTADETMSDSRVRYWFWSSKIGPLGAQRLMVCSRTDKEGKRSIVVALGDSSVMDALRMSPDAARADISKSESILREAK